MQSSSLLGFLGVGDNKTVHVHNSFFGQTLAHSDRSSIDGGFEFGSSNETSGLKLGKAVADNLSCGHSGVLSLGSISLLSSEVLAESLDSNLLSHVELVADSGSTDVEPVLVVRRELLKACSLSVLGPLRY